ncbi:MAG: efflux RND transporter periplasmic adaptor subunit [Phycisphaerales bacterium]|nr:efflux RND transporter periplasmic adaptor subunit [Phycisphaerales bacterium]
MKTRLGVPRRLALATVVAAASVLSPAAGLAFGVHQDTEQPTGQPTSAATKSPASPQEGRSGSPGTSAVSFADLAASFGGEKSFTRAWKDSVMGFSQSSRVLEILAVGGHAVKKGQLLVRGEDEEEVARLELQRMRADSTLNVDKARKSVELATLLYDRYRQAEDRGATNKLEIDRALLDKEASEIDLGLAQLNQDQEVIAVRLAQARLDRIRVVAPFDGIVETVYVDVGQAVAENDQVLRVVDTSILWTDVGVPTGQTIELNLTLGGKAWALMNLPGEPKVYEGRIVEISPVADSSSNTRRVRVEIANPTSLVAGVTTWVRFTEPTGEWASRIVPAPSVAPTAQTASTASTTSGGDAR